nr:glycosyltransferase family 4 protein [uncultured Massilia sp.]
MRILYLTYEPWPTHRADIEVLFGRYLRRHGIVTDLVAEAEQCGAAPASGWAGGAVIGCARPRRRALQHLAKLWLNVKTVARADKRRHDCIQVRDMSLSALAGLAAARIKGIPFVYWLSYLQSEGHIVRARARGPRAGLKYWYPLLEGLVGRFILYRIVLPRADHVFVQSDAMKARLAAMGVPAARMSAVPMGVDLEEGAALPAPAPVPELAGRRALVYLGIQDRERRVELLLQMLAAVKEAVPDAVLVMAGDTPDEAYRAWLRGEAARLGVADDVIWTGWIARTDAWRYVRAAEIGLSPFPRGEVLDTCSPTKAVEYMALGVPVVGNDNPDQLRVIEDSGAGLCVPLDPARFADAVVALLRDDALRGAMARRGQDYVRMHRSYARLAAQVAATYEKVCNTSLGNIDEKASISPPVR